VSHGPQESLGTLQVERFVCNCWVYILYLYPFVGPFYSNPIHSSSSEASSDST
jgi:hypothetical protein